jgi:hypothetical protein
MLREQKLEIQDAQADYMDVGKTGKILTIAVPTYKVETLAEVRKIREEAEKAISAILTNFEERSGVKIKAVEERTGPTPGGKPYWKTIIVL